jgi:hypothetical protein
MIKNIQTFNMTLDENVYIKSMCTNVKQNYIDTFFYFLFYYYITGKKSKSVNIFYIY